MALAGKIALITGGASGLGRAAAARFLLQGARVAIVDLPTSEGEKVAKEFGAEKSLFQAADVTSETDVKGVLDAIEKAFQAAPNVVINCAGIAPPAKVLGRKGPHSLELFQSVLNINVSGTFNVLRLAAERMAAAEPYNADGERGVIINTASVAAFDGQVGQAAYAASKGAIAALTLPLARDLSSHGIRVNTIAPGIMLTPMMAGLPQKAQDVLSELVQFPKRLGDPDEYASLAQHIVENHYMNGETIRLDGSLRMPAK